MELFQAIILGIIQGITEWLPVSSSGHLVLAQTFFGLEQPIVFDLMLHLGSLLVVFVFFWKEIKELIMGLFKLEKEKFNMLLFIFLATIPIAIVGYFFQEKVEYAFNSLLVVALGLIFTSLLLFFSRYPRKKEGKLSPLKAFGIGIFQAIAILPGVSRSGSTISLGMMLGIKKEDVAKFSFLIFIPAILGATLLQIIGGGFEMIENVWIMVLGTVVSAVVGFFSLKLLMNVIKKDRFFWFGVYCLVLGLITLIFGYVLRAG